MTLFLDLSKLIKAIANIKNQCDPKTEFCTGKVEKHVEFFFNVFFSKHVFYFQLCPIAFFEIPTAIKVRPV